MGDAMRFLRLALATSAGVPAARTSLYHGQLLLPDRVSVASSGLANGDTVVLTVAADPAVATAADDGTACIWRLSDGLCLHRLAGHNAPVTAVAWSADGGCVATAACAQAGRVSLVRLWCTQDGVLRRQIESHSTAPLTALAFSDDGDSLGAASIDGSAQLWFTWNGRCVQTFEGHAKAARSVSFSSTGRLMCTASDDGTVRICQISGGCMQVLGPLPGKPAMLCAAFSPDSALVTTVSADGVPRRWRVDDGACVQTFNCSWPGATSAIATPNGLAAAVFGQGLGTGPPALVAVWRASEDRALTLRAAEGCPLALTAGGNQVVCGGSQAGLAEVLDVDRGQLLRKLEERGGGLVLAAAFSL